MPIRNREDYGAEYLHSVHENHHSSPDEQITHYSARQSHEMQVRAQTAMKSFDTRIFNRPLRAEDFGSRKTGVKSRIVLERREAVGDSALPKGINEGGDGVCFLASDFAWTGRCGCWSRVEGVY